MTAFHFCGTLDDRGFFDRLGETLHHFHTDLGVTHLTAAKTDGDLDFVAAFHETDGVTHLGLEIGNVGVQAEAHLFDLHHALIFAGFLFALGLLKAVLAVVHNAADGGLSVGRDLDQIQFTLVGEFLRLASGHHAELFAVGADHADFRVADLFIDLCFFFFRSDGKTPPKYKNADCISPREYTARFV